MDVRLNEIELQILAHLHEHARGYNAAACFDPNEVAQALAVTPDELVLPVSYLQDWGLVGDCGLGCLDDGSLGPFHFTAQGENFVRQLEATNASEPRVPMRITLVTMKSVLGASRDIIVQVASSVLGKMLGAS